MKTPSIFDLFAAPIKVLRSFRMQPRRVECKRMQTKQFDEGVIHYSSFRAAYLQPKPKRYRTQIVAGPGGLPLLDATGNVVRAQFAIPEPWRRVTPKGPSKRRAHRAAVAARVHA